MGCPALARAFTTFKMFMCYVPTPPPPVPPPHPPNMFNPSTTCPCMVVLDMLAKFSALYLENCAKFIETDRLTDNPLYRMIQIYLIIRCIRRYRYRL